MKKIVKLRKTMLKSVKTGRVID